MFYDFGALLKAIQASYNPNTHTSELEILASVFDAEALVLDELGASKPTEWMLDTMLQNIRARYNDKRLTIFTSNYLDERSGRESETLEDRIGAQLRSRLYQMCKAVKSGSDNKSPQLPLHLIYLKHNKSGVCYQTRLFRCLMTLFGRKRIISLL